ncbi:MAG: preprotein translocase subunit YajC, partial [Akkermansia sp.]|nr:preprotein translocase subunit YajC [Akkermansia sp.]
MNAIYIAQAAAGQEGDPLNMLITFGLIGVIFYFLLIRPQRKQQKELKE